MLLGSSALCRVPVVSAVMATVFLTQCVGAARADEPSTLPAANAVLTAPPGEVAVQAGADGQSGTIAVLDSHHRRVGGAPATVRDGRLAAPLTDLKPGLYTAVWQLPGGQPAAGSFSFAVDPEGTDAALVRDVAPPAELRPLSMALPKFFAFAFVMTLIGTLALRFLVTTRAVVELGETARPVAG